MPEMLVFKVDVTFVVDNEVEAIIERTRIHDQKRMSTNPNPNPKPNPNPNPNPTIIDFGIAVCR